MSGWFGHGALALALSVVACAGPPTIATTTSELVATDPVAVDFGSVQLGTTAPPRSVIVRPQGLLASSDEILSITESCNDFTLDLSTLGSPPVVERVCGGENPNPFFIPPGECENFTQTFRVGFTPSVIGAQSCVVTIAMASTQLKTVTLTGAGTAPPVALTLVSPAARMIDFGEVVVGTASETVPVVLRGDGTEPAEYTTMPLPSGFIKEGALLGGLAGGETATIEVSCRPTAPGSITGTLAINSNDPDQPTIPIALRCTGIVSNLTSTPSLGYFSPVVMGEQGTISLRLANAGAAPMTIDEVAVEPADAFTVTALEPGMVAPNTSKSVELSFTPRPDLVDTDVAGTLTVRFSPPLNQVRTIALLAPVRRTELSLNAGDLDFGVVCAGTTSRRTLEAVNLGSRFSRLDTLLVSGAGFTLEYLGSPPFTLEAAAATSFEFEVVADASAGAATGELTLATDAPDGVPLVRSLRAVSQAAGIGADPQVVAFDGTPVGGASGVQQVRITNCDAAPIEIVSQGISGPNAAEFFVTGTPIDLALGLGETATWLVELRPSTAGEKVAALDLVHAGGVISVPLTGVGDGPLAGGRGSYYACSTGGGGGSLWLLALALVPLARPRRRARREAGSRA